MKNLIVSFVLIFILFTMPALAVGPWKGKVIDIETKEPLEGAVVLAVWDRVYRTPYGANSYFYEAKEVLTDKEGRFKIPSYTPINLLPIISYMRGPMFTIFKPGYGSLSMELGKYLTGEKGLSPYGGELSGYTIRVFSGLIELQKLKTREQRVRSLRAVFGSPIGEAPDYKLKNLLELIDIENRNLGFKK